MNRIAASFLASCSLVVVVNSAGAYETPTHWKLSNAAFGASNLVDEKLLRQLGLHHIANKEIFKPSHTESDSELIAVDPSCDPKVVMRIQQIVSCGAMFEDLPGVRSFNHFFDPISGEPLMVGKKLPGAILGGLPNMTSPDWAIQDTNSISAQQFSYRRAREYLVRAIVESGPANLANGRNDQWALLFQSLGHVIHHVQDMAQPQHTRNDPHADWLTSIFGLGQFFNLRHPSRFEKYSKTRLGELKIDLAMSDSIPPIYPAHSEKFKKPRDFWTGAGRGLADFSNANFVSQGTNFAALENGALSANSKYSSPVPSGFVNVSLVTAFGSDPVPPSIAKLCEDVGIQYCEMTFYSNQWIDPLTNVPNSNLRASTASIFDEDLNGTPFTYSWDDGQVTTTRMYAMNQLNFDAAFMHLIPKAVAYSAGLINYFFRGKMEITLPADGIYALVDHHAQRCKDTCGFSKVKLKLKNTTPDEDMGAGTLRAVAKFHRNSCYRESLSGDPGGVDFTGVTCRSAQEEVVVSDPVALLSLGTQEERELTFAFPLAIPINATDLYLQVVFQGMLGEEADAVAVTTKDIAEPNYFAFTNVTDKAYDFGDHTYHPLPYRAYAAPDSIYGISVAFRDGASPLAHIAQLDAANHGQVAFLTDPGRQFLDIRYTSHQYTVGSPIRGTIPVSEFVGDVEASIYGRSVEFTLSRGMYRDYYEYHRLPPDFTTYDCRIEIELCAQSTMAPFTPASAIEWTITF